MISSINHLGPLSQTLDYMQFFFLRFKMSVYMWKYMSIERCVHMCSFARSVTLEQIPLETWKGLQSLD